MVAQEDLNNPTLNVIHEKYLACLRSFAKKHFPNQPNRVDDLLVRLPEVQVAASLLLESKMFYVPFLLNSMIDRSSNPFIHSPNRQKRDDAAWSYQSVEQYR